MLYRALVRRTLSCLAFVVCLVVTPPCAMALSGASGRGALADDDAGPRATVERLNDALIAAMKTPGVDGYSARWETLDPVVRDSFDFPTVARLVLGARWKTYDQPTRDRFLDVFSRYVVANYAAEFDSYSGHEFRTDEVREQHRGVVVVRCTLSTGSGETHPFDYQLREKGGHWLIINVAVDGVSDLALKRSQYAAVIKKNGFDALLSTLEDKVRGFARGEKDDD